MGTADGVVNQRYEVDFRLAHLVADQRRGLRTAENNRTRCDLEAIRSSSTSVAAW
jgi:hypothetical protein